jgi:hypothetical protein
MYGSAQIFALLVKLFARQAVLSSYQGILQRDPEPEGLNSYVKSVRKSLELSDLLADLVNSQEHWKKLLLSHSNELSTAVFHTFLQRSPDQKDLDSFKSVVEETGDISSLLREIASSDEYWYRLLDVRAQELVGLLFQGLLGRNPEPEALTHYADRLRQAHDLAALLSEIADSREQWQKSLRRRAPEIAATAFRALLEREPEPEALASYSALLSRTHDLGLLLSEIAGSQEHWNKLVAQNSTFITQSAFEALLSRAPYAHELAEHDAQLKKSHSITQLLQSIVNDPEHWEKMIVAHAKSLVDSIYWGVLKRFPEPAEATTHVGGLKSLRSITSLLEALVEGVVIAEIDKVKQQKTSERLPTQVIDSLNAPNTTELIDGFYKEEPSGFAWSRLHSSIQVHGYSVIYLSCNYLAPLEQRKIVVQYEDTEYEVILPDSFVCREITIDSRQPILVNFSADGVYSPALAGVGVGGDTRELAFQLWRKTPDVFCIDKEVPKRPSLIFVADQKKEIDSLRPTYDRIRALGLRTEFMDTASAVNMARNERTICNCFVIAGALTYVALVNNGANAKFVYMEHGIAPLKIYTYWAHYRQYDLALLPGVLWTERLIRLYPELAGRCKAVGYAKLKLTYKSSAEERDSLCKKLQLDPLKPIILFAPSWSGNNRDCGIYNLRFFDKSSNLFTVPHDGDMQFVKEFIDAGYRVCRPGENESISDYYGVADILVSDISSTAVEFAAIGKPVICISTPSIQDFEARFRESEFQIRIPHTDSYWDFCDWSSREDINAVIKSTLAKPLTGKELKSRQKKVKRLIAYAGEDAVAHSTRAILEFLNQPMFNISEK